MIGKRNLTKAKIINSRIKTSNDIFIPIIHIETFGSIIDIND